LSAPMLDLVVNSANSSKEPFPNDACGSILCVDDDSSSLDLLSELLSMNGFRVFSAGGGVNAISIFEKERPELVITDIRMPSVDGLEVLRRVRETDDTTAVILVTGYGDLENALGALRRGAYDFLMKPINPDILLSAANKGIEICRLKRFEKNYRRLLEEQVKERTQELAKINDFLQGILDSSTHVAIMITDFDHNVIFWNTGAENIYGYSESEIMGCSILKLYPEDSARTEIAEELRSMLQSSAGTLQGNIRQLAKDGRELTISKTVSPMLDASGNVRGILAVGQDVTKESHLQEQLLKSYKRIQRIQGASILALARLAESRDPETAFHLRRLQAYCRLLCDRLALKDKYKDAMTQEFIEDLVQCSVLHDIGKVALPDSILFTPKKYTEMEFEIMKQHAVKGGQALEEAAQEVGEKECYLMLGKDVAYFHHEKWDGTGYPSGLSGEDIPFVARIVSIADVYDALTTRRRYKRAYSHQEACMFIAGEKGKQFDPELVDLFIEIDQEFKKIRDSFSRSDLQDSVESDWI
jgi:PAS domain S-box-containing protein